jgi:beta-galactosidase
MTFWNSNLPMNLHLFLQRLGVCLALIVFAECAQAGQSTLQLAGKWRFALDRTDTGVNEQWFARDLPDKIKLPGALQSQGYGDEISTNTPWVLSLYDKNWFLRADYTNYAQPGKVKVPFVCQPPRHYLGAAWYQRDVDIPADWKGRRVVLFLERPHWESRVWLDDKPVGTNNSLCAPHEFDLGIVRPGKHRLTVRVDNRLILPYRPDAHAVSDSLGSTWNGIVGKMELRSTPPVWIENAQVFTDATNKTAHVVVRVGNTTGKPGYGSLSLVKGTFSPSNPIRLLGNTVNWETNGGTGEITFALGENAKLWDEFNPVLHKFTIILFNNETDSHEMSFDAREMTFGLREIKAVGTDFEINGRNTYMRGTHHGGDFPLTGYPPTDVEYWRKLFATCQDWGLNHVRFHSFCPPEAAFTAADEVGFYLSIEPGMWNTISPDTPMEAMLYAETERILKAYGNHPSFVMFSPSNEPKGRWKEALPKWAEHFRAADARHLYTSGTGFTDADAPGPLDRVDFITTQRFGSRRVRGESAWFGGDYSRSLEGVSVPVVAHELGQWCAYPDFSVIRKFTGYARPGNYQIFLDSAKAHGVLEKNKDFAFASGRFQLECYKEEIEANLRTPGLAGFQLLDLHDYTGQGTALVGLLDPFWESKGYATPHEFRGFCDTTVPLARLRKRVFTTEDKFDVPVEMAHYGAAELTNAQAIWQITDASGKAVAGGKFPAVTIPIGKNFALGNVVADLSALAAPAAYKLAVQIRGAGFQPASLSSDNTRLKKKVGDRLEACLTFSNDWDFWLYPAQVSTNAPFDVLITSSWDEAEPHCAAGGKVLFLPRKADLNWPSPPLADVPVFWNRLMNPNWGRMFGLWCDAKHPALAGFPTEVNCDWQWTPLVNRARAMNLGRLPRGLKPIVQAIDDWNRNWKLGLVFECAVGRGKLMVCTLDLETDLDSRPGARQLRRSLLDYMAGKKFKPATKVSATDFRAALFDTLIMRRLGATATASSGTAQVALDGDPNTFWVAGGSGRGADGRKHPHELTINFPSSVAMNGVTLMNRQNDRDHLGDVRAYTLETSADGTNWREVARGELASTWNPQEVRFKETIAASHLKFTALSGYGNDTSAALGELAVIYSGPKLAAAAGDVEYQRVRSTSSDVDEGATPPSQPTTPGVERRN